MDHTTERPSLRIRLAVVVVVLETLALIVFGALDLRDVHSDRVVLAVGTSLFFFGYGGLLLVAARGLWRLAGWVRGPLVFSQLIQLGIGWSLRDASPAIAIVLAAAALLVIWCLLSPATNRRFAALDEEARSTQR